MHRRNILWGAISAFGAAFAASRANAASEAAPPAKLKVVYHLNDLDKVSFVLGNIQNHLDGVGGPDHVTIALWFMARRCGRFIRLPPVQIFRSASTSSPKPASNSPCVATP